MKCLEHLAQRMQQLQQQQTPGVCMIVPAEDSTHHLIVTGQRGQRRESVHQTEGEAHAAYHSFLQTRHTTEPTLIVIDV